jgi:hypothetical protein
MLDGGEGEVLEHHHAQAHPWEVESWPEMVGGGLPTYASELTAADAGASNAPARPVRWRSKQVNQHHGIKARINQKTERREVRQRGLATVRANAAVTASCRGGKRWRGQVWWCEARRGGQRGAQGRGEAVRSRNWAEVLWRRLIMPATWSCCMARACRAENEKGRAGQWLGYLTARA